MNVHQLPCNLYIRPKIYRPSTAQLLLLDKVPDFKNFI